MRTKLKNLNDKAQDFGTSAAQIISHFVGTWKFVGLYVCTVLLWLTLHMSGVLNFDDPTFHKFDLVLKFFGSIQATIILMSSSKQSAIDRKRNIHGLELDQKTLQISHDSNKKIMKMLHQIEQLENIIDELITEREKKNEEEDGHRE